MYMYIHICTHVSLEDPIAHVQLWTLHPPQVIAHSKQTPLSHQTWRFEKINTGGLAVKTGSVTGKREFNAAINMTVLALVQVSEKAIFPSLLPIPSLSSYTSLIPISTSPCLPLPKSWNLYYFLCMVTECYTRTASDKIYASSRRTPVQVKPCIVVLQTQQF